MYKKTIYFLFVLVLGLIPSTSSQLANSFERNLTFITWSDSHFGAYDYADPTRLRIIDQINNMNPESVNGIFLTKPEFLLHLGDITEHGYESEWSSPDLPDQRSFLQTIRHLDKDITAYEILGNHDSRKAGNVRGLFKKRHKSTYYSFDRQSVHFVVLDPYPFHNTAAPSLDDKQFQWLVADLEKLSPETPIIIAMHVQPNSNRDCDRTSKPDPKSSEKLAGIIKDKNVLCFLHGHWHINSLTKWNNIDVIAPSGFTYWRNGCKKGHPTLGIINITNDRFSVLTWDWDKEIFHDKPLLVKNFAAIPYTKESSDDRQPAK